MLSFPDFTYAVVKVLLNIRVSIKIVKVLIDTG